MNLDMLKLAIKSGLPLIHVTTEDLVNVEQVLSFVADEPAKPVELPEVSKELVSKVFGKAERVLYTSSKCDYMVKLYRTCVEQEKTIVFVNTEKSVLQFSGGSLIPPKELVQKFLSDISETPDILMPCVGGMTLKDIGEVAKMTMTRDEALTPRGINTTRRGYKNFKGINPVNVQVPYYLCPSYLKTWLDKTAKFFLNPIHEALIPRGLLFSGGPGVGKTMAAKHIASVLGVPLYHMDIGAMKGKYVGESETNLLSALAQADQVEPCVSPTSLIRTTVGTITAQELYDRSQNEKFTLQSIDPATGAPCVVNLYRMIKRENKEVIRLNTENGSITCTRDHKLLCTREGKLVWIPAGELSVGDEVLDGCNG